MNKESNHITEHVNPLNDLHEQIPKFAEYKHILKKEGSLYSNDEISQIEKFIKDKEDFIQSNEVKITTIVNSILGKVSSKSNESDIINHLKTIIHYFNENISTIYEIPNNDYLRKKVNDYSNYFDKIHVLIVNSNFEFLSNTQYIEIVHSIKKDFNFWDEVVRYELQISKNEVVRFNNAHFNFEFNRIDDFYKIILIQHMEEYNLFLKYRFATTLCDIDSINFEYKLNRIHEYYQRYKQVRDVTTDGNKIEFTYHTLKRLGMDNDLANFEKIVTNRKGTLTFPEYHDNIKNHVSYLGIVIIRLFKILYGDFQIIEVKTKVGKTFYPYLKLKNTSNSNYSKKNLVTDDINSFISTKNFHVDDWQNKFMQSNYFRTNLILSGRFPHMY